MSEPSARSSRKGHGSRGPSSVTACMSRSRDFSPTASTGTDSVSGARSVRPGARRPRRLPAPSSSNSASRVCGCSHYETGYFTAYRRIAQEQFDFVFHTGDYIYEGRGDGGGPTERVRLHPGQEIYTLVDYRNRYALYKIGPRSHRRARVGALRDDLGRPRGGQRLRQRPRRERDAARSVPAAPRSGVPGVLEVDAAQAVAHFRPVLACALYRRLVFGDLIDMSVLDTRQYRSDQVCDGGSTPDCAARVDPARSMLGAAQERWLFENLGNTKARWTVLGQQVPTFARDNGAAATLRPLRDGQMGWLRGGSRSSVRAAPGDEGAESRRALRRRPRALRRRPEARLREAGVGDGRCRVHEHVDHLRRRRLGRRSQLGADQRRDNPHLKYHSSRRGYISCTATPATMRAEFKVLDRVTVPDQPARVGGTLVAEAGKPGSVTD